MKLDTHDPKPFLKWAGGKSSVLSSLHSYLPEHFSNFHEPMIGGGAFFIDLKKDKNTNRKLAVAYQHSSIFVWRTTYQRMD